MGGVPMIVEALQKFSSTLKSRMIYRVQAAHVIRSVALSLAIALMRKYLSNREEEVVAL